MERYLTTRIKSDLDASRAARYLLASQRPASSLWSKSGSACPLEGGYSLSYQWPCVYLNIRPYRYLEELIAIRLRTASVFSNSNNRQSLQIHATQRSADCPVFLRYKVSLICLLEHIVIVQAIPVGNNYNDCCTYAWWTVFRGRNVLPNGL